MKTKEQKQAALAEEIRKKQEQLEKMQKNKLITSSRQIREELDTVDDDSDSVSVEFLGMSYCQLERISSKSVEKIN